MKRNYWLLAGSICLDVIGVGLGVVVPAVSDLVTAPLNFVWIRLVLESSNTLAIVGAGEELLPGTDFIPSCSIAWLIG